MCSIDNEKEAIFHQTKPNLRKIPYHLSNPFSAVK
ncbi:unnamed protein product [Photorhabdus laumondii subsp. laumondii TTO1]|uniref:Photorhabdus luminescens subsp. laumondii TTO1 complete genome segment 16/17 n=1 Tax=Photorhabdus laumondii subsp. laumondii (strain DSM 15139 / CIP 105565 / TT01) TaxID=243265 RepID=Q7MYD4_PHOLL|nr:unnamed protein product [Photorhabdus laumondii subsp. laumondii TTO1]